MNCRKGATSAPVNLLIKYSLYRRSSQVRKYVVKLNIHYEALRSIIIQLGLPGRTRALVTSHNGRLQRCLTIQKPP